MASSVVEQEAVLGQTLATAVAAAVSDVVTVSDSTREGLMVALLARGHVLIEGVPGTGKTLLVRTLSRALGLPFRRIQFTNDLMPSDVVGSSVWRPSTERFEFVPGPVFASLVLADEINRTSPRTLSCLLEVMECGTVSVDGETRRLPNPFMVLATRNPVEFHGTFPMPEAAMDRFLMRIEVDYPADEDEIALLHGGRSEDRVPKVRPQTNEAALLRAMEAVSDVEVSDPVVRYAHAVVKATRSHPAIELGLSPRAALAWIGAARARALLEGRAYVLPDDLQLLARRVLAHRLVTRSGEIAQDLVDRLIEETPVPL